MTEPPLLPAELAPSRFLRAPVASRRPDRRAPRQRRHAGRRLAVLAAAIAVPADGRAGRMAARRARRARAAGQAARLRGAPARAFPGSAFYYLDDLPNLRNPAARGPADATELALPRPSAGLLEAGPAARALRVAGSLSDRSRAQYCLTLAVYYEAASEPDAGQRAVAQVVLNRVAHPAYPDTVCGVVFQGSERTTGCQFSFTCDGSLARKPAKMWWDRAATVARAALSGTVYAPVGLATHYHTVQIHPYWADSLDTVGTIGAHRFYRWRGAAGRSAAFSDVYLGGEPAGRAARAPRASRHRRSKPIRWRSLAPTRPGIGAAAVGNEPVRPPLRRPTPPRSKRAAATRCTRRRRHPPPARCARSMPAAGSGCTSPTKGELVNAGATFRKPFVPTIA